MFAISHRPSASTQSCSGMDQMVRHALAAPRPDQTMVFTSHQTFDPSKCTFGVRPQHRARRLGKVLMVLIYTFRGHYGLPCIFTSSFADSLDNVAAKPAGI